MPRRAKYDSVEIKVEQNPLDIEQNPLEIHETWVKLEDIKKEELEEAPTYQSDSDCASASVKSESTENSEKPQRKVIQLTKTECQICGTKMTQKNLNRHMKNLHPEVANLPFSCTVCIQKFVSMEGVRKHMSAMHASTAAEPEEFICDYDGKVFKSRTELHGHMQVHKTSKLQKIKCEVCQIEIQQRYFNRHMSEVHTDIKVFKCDICSTCVKTSRALQIHKKVHNKELECEICSKSFAIQSRLKLHMKTVHEKEKESFMCEECGKEFDKKVNLDRHKKTHQEKERKFKCDRCPWTFYINYDLKKHQKVHEKEDAKAALMENSVQCEVCSKHLTNKKALSKHMKTVHQDEPNQFQCPVCATTFKAKRSLDAHMKKQKCESKNL